MMMTALNTLLLLLVALAIPGVINRTRALLAGRRGIRFLQHLYHMPLPQSSARCPPSTSARPSSPR